MPKVRYHAPELRWLSACRRPNCHGRLPGDVLSSEPMHPFTSNRCRFVGVFGLPAGCWMPNNRDQAPKLRGQGSRQYDSITAAHPECAVPRVQSITEAHPDGVKTKPKSKKASRKLTRKKSRGKFLPLRESHGLPPGGLLDLSGCGNPVRPTFIGGLAARAPLQAGW